MIKKLRMKFILVNMIIVTLMLAIIFGLIIYFTRSNLEHESIQLLHSLSLKPPKPDLSDEMLKEIDPLLFVINKMPDGEYRVFGVTTFDLSDKALMSELFEAAINTGVQTGILEEYSLRYFVHIKPMMQEIAFADISGEQKVLRQLAKTCVLIAVISFAAFFVISLILARWIVKPVEKTWNQQKQFVADASHEIKTPLTVIMTNAEMLHDSDYSEEKRIQFSDNILIMAKQMRGLTENMLELARSDNYTAVTNLADVDLSGLVNDAVLPFEPLYFEKGLTLECEIENGILIKGDSVHLYRLVDVFLDNALKYSYTKSAVRIKLKKRSHNCIISVESKGDTISRVDLKNIFKRFYCIDKSRSANGSYGLGLSIAELIAKEHCGKIWAESACNINCFYVKFPVI